MSFLAKLEIDGKTYTILECRYGFSQNTDSTGKPQGMPDGGDLFIRIESKADADLLTWMLDHNQTKDGKIIYFRRDAMSKLQELSFKKAYCIRFSEYFNANGSEPLQIELILSAQSIEINGIVHKKLWKSII